MQSLDSASRAIAATRSVSLALGSLTLLAVTATPAEAGGGASFQTGLSATSQVQNNGESVSNSDDQPDAASGPAQSEALLPDRIARSSADFAGFLNQTFVAGEPIAPSSLAIALATARDAVTVHAPGSPSGSTRLELTYRVEGTINGFGFATLGSLYGVDTDDVPSFDGGEFMFTAPGTVDTQITFSYDDIPLGDPWNLSIRVETLVPGLGSTSWINLSTTLTSVKLMIDDIPVTTSVAGVSGNVYVRCVPTDFDGDGVTGFSDLSSLLAAWGTCGACVQDLDANGQIGFADLSDLLSRWGPCE